MEDAILNDRTVIEIGVWFIGLLLIVIAYLYRTAEKKKDELKKEENIAVASAFVDIKNEIKGMREDIKDVVFNMHVEGKEIRVTLNDHELRLREQRNILDQHTERLKSKS